MKNILFLLFTLAVCTVAAQPSDTGHTFLDTAGKNNKLADTARHSHVGSIIPGVVLVTYGGLSLFVKPVRNVDYYFKGLAANADANQYAKISDYIQLAPGVTVYALNLFGDEGKDRFWDRTALLALSGAFLTIADGTKYLAHRDRPYGTDPLSFPSGHTGAAFVAAEFMAQEYGDKSPWYSVAAYTCGAATGILRVYGHAHWFSDCVAGAGIGILSTKAAYWLYPHIKNALTHKDKHGRMSTLVPSFQYGAPGFAFTMQL